MLVGGCLELGADGLPFAPFTAVLRDLVRELGLEAIAGMLAGRAIRELARLLPELGEAPTGVDPGEARARMFEQMLVLLGHLAERAPVILVIEDAHWADRSSRDLLSFLVRNQRALEGVLIVVTYRSDELHRTPPPGPESCWRAASTVGGTGLRTARRRRRRCDWRARPVIRPMRPAPCSRWR